MLLVTSSDKAATLDLLSGKHITLWKGPRIPLSQFGPYSSQEAFAIGLRDGSAAQNQGDSRKVLTLEPLDKRFTV